MNQSILFKLTTKRYEQAWETVQNINEKTNTAVHFIITVGDDVPEWFKECLMIPALAYFNGVEIDHSTTKIGAINNHVPFRPSYHWDILVNVSDDNRFLVQGFEDIIRYQFDRAGTNDLFLHFPDGNRKDFSTMSIMGREYYERDKYIYNPAYISLCADVEATEVAKLRGCYRYCDTQIFEHNHPSFRKGKMDELYIKNNTFMADKRTLEYRKRNNYFL